MDPTVLIFDTPREAADACGDRTLELLAGRPATLAVSGGSTPRLMFQTMSSRPFDWSQLRIFQVDERCVPPDDALSNVRMIRESLGHEFSMIRGELPPEEAARLYAAEIRAAFGLAPGELPVFDVIQRGMGPDAHTASLFPGDPWIADRAGIAAAVEVENIVRHRVTLLPGVLERAKHTLCLAAGADKADALRNVLQGPRDPMRFPAQIASPDTVWYVDRLAAQRL